VLRFSRKTREQYVQSEVDGKPAGWRAFYADGRWVEVNGGGNSTEDGNGEGTRKKVAAAASLKAKASPGKKATPAKKAAPRKKTASRKRTADSR
jgi:DNA topoisomerase-1